MTFARTLLVQHRHSETQSIAESWIAIQSRHQQERAKHFNNKKVGAVEFARSPCVRKLENARVRLPWRCAQTETFGFGMGFDYKAINHIHRECESRERARASTWWSLVAAQQICVACRIYIYFGQLCAERTRIRNNDLDENMKMAP